MYFLSQIVMSLCEYLEMKKKLLARRMSETNKMLL